MSDSMHPVIGSVTSVPSSVTSSPQRIGTRKMQAAPLGEHTVTPPESQEPVIVTSYQRTIGKVKEIERGPFKQLRAIHENRRAMQKQFTQEPDLENVVTRLRSRSEVSLPPNIRKIVKVKTQQIAKKIHFSGLSVIHEKSPSNLKNEIEKLQYEAYVLRAKAQEFDVLIKLEPNNSVAKEVAQEHRKQAFEKEVEANQLKAELSKFEILSTEKKISDFIEKIKSFIIQYINNIKFFGLEENETKETMNRQLQELINDPKINQLSKEELKALLRGLGGDRAAEFTALVLEQELATIKDPTTALRANTLTGKLYSAFLAVYCSQKISDSELMKDFLDEVHKRDSAIHIIETAKKNDRNQPIDFTQAKQKTNELYEKICAFVESTTSSPALKKVHERLYKAVENALEKTGSQEKTKKAQAFLMGNFFLYGVNPEIAKQAASLRMKNQVAGDSLMYLSKAFQNIAQNVTNTEKEPHMKFSNELAKEFDLSRVHTILNFE